MLLFAQACAAIAAKAGRLEKLAVLAQYLRSLDDADLAAAARFFTGNPFAARDERSLRIGWRTIVAAAKSAWDVRETALAAGYREHGDLGAALGPLVRPGRRPGLFSETLTPASLSALFHEIARASGKSAERTREAICERILAACTDPVEATYTIKIMTGDLRIGLREGLVADAVAAAFSAEPKAVRRAMMASGDAGEVALAAKHGTLAALRITYGLPIGFMLATPIAYGSEYKDLQCDTWLSEEKFDGIRLQAHKDERGVRLFSRTLNEVTGSYPEVVAGLAAIAGTFMVDGELIAQRGNSVLPFRYLQARLQRKTVDRTLREEVPVVYVVFDILAHGDAYLIDEPLAERKVRLAGTIVPSAHVHVAPFERVASPFAERDLHARFESARARGHEGLVLKRADSPYHPGRRGKWWLKLKRELSTLDVVVVAVEWGHGKRAKVLSDYTFAVRGTSDELLTIGKAYSGLTDAEIGELTQWFLAHEQGRRGHAIAVQPAIVLEIAFDIIQPSSLHESGFALRFPRIVRIRDDKPAAEIDTLDRVREIYQEMLSRENVRGKGPPGEA